MCLYLNMSVNESCFVIVILFLIVQRFQTNGHLSEIKSSIAITLPIRACNWRKNESEISWMRRDIDRHFASHVFTHCLRLDSSLLWKLCFQSYYLIKCLLNSNKWKELTRDVSREIHDSSLHCGYLCSIPNIELCRQNRFITTTISNQNF